MSGEYWQYDDRYIARIPEEERRDPQGWETTVQSVEYEDPVPVNSRLPARMRTEVQKCLYQRASKGILCVASNYQRASKGIRCVASKRDGESSPKRARGRDERAAQVLLLDVGVPNSAAGERHRAFSRHI
jgi:hypothetical protein